MEDEDLDDEDLDTSRDTLIGRAKSMIGQLVTARQLVLKRRANRDRLATALGEWLIDHEGAERLDDEERRDLGDFLLERPEVEELYADDETLAALFESTRNVKTEIPTKPRYWDQPEWLRWMADVITAKLAFGERTLAVRTVGQVCIPSGRILALDPLLPQSPEPFHRGAQPGTYPLEVIAVLHPTAPRPINGYAVLRFSAAAPVKWEHATKGTESIEDLGADCSFRIGVDTGVCCLIDETQRASVEAAGSAITAAVNAHPEGLVTVDTGSGPIIVLSSGYGDGSYPAFFGLTEANEACCLVLDFQVMGRPAPGEY